MNFSYRLCYYEADMVIYSEVLLFDTRMNKLKCTLSHLKKRGINSNIAKVNR